MLDKVLEVLDKGSPFVVAKAKPRAASPGASPMARLSLQVQVAASYRRGICSHKFVAASSARAICSHVQIGYPPPCHTGSSPRF